MIDKLIENEEYEKALDLLKNDTSEIAGLQKVICYFSLKKHEKVINLARVLLQNETSNYYYDILSLYIASLVEIEEDEAAIKLLEEELSMPYIPGEFENIFNDTYNRLIKKHKQANKNYSPYDLYNDDEIKSLLENNEKEEILLLCVNQLQKRNIRNFLLEIKSFLKNSEKPNFLKTIILESLNEQNIEEELDIINKDGMTISVIPTELTPLFERESLIEVNNIIEAKVENDISLLEYCFNISTSYFASIYPIDLSKDEYSYVAASVYYYALTLSNIEKPIEEVANLFDVKKEFLSVYYDTICNVNEY
ncbi:MAG: hypothetical protein WC123_00140 [Bacilli bacterium]|nr:hypothetical protein [Bacilli bacterium]